MEKRKITEKAPNLDAALAVKDTMVGGTRQKLDALNKKKREAFGKETYQLDLSALDTYSMSPYKKPTLLSTGAKVSSSGKEKSLYGATGQTHGEEDKPYSFLPGILGKHLSTFSFSLQGKCLILLQACIPRRRSTSLL